jgi:hypothetical protein
VLSAVLSAVLRESQLLIPYLPYLTVCVCVRYRYDKDEYNNLSISDIRSIVMVSLHIHMCLVSV